jgi:hypothetical protein
MPAIDIDDAQPPMAKPDLVVSEQPTAVRAAVGKRPSHLSQKRRINGPSIEVQKAGYSTHVRRLWEARDEVDKASPSDLHPAACAAV